MAKALAEFLYQDPRPHDPLRHERVRAPRRGRAADRRQRTRLAGAARRKRSATSRSWWCCSTSSRRPIRCCSTCCCKCSAKGRLTDGAGRVADFTQRGRDHDLEPRRRVVSPPAVGFRGEAAAGEIAAAALRAGGESVPAAGDVQPPRPHRAVRSARSRDDCTASPAARSTACRGRDGLRLRGIELDIDAAAIDHLAAAGYDPRYGARPLKRAIERQLVAPLAEQLNRYGSDVAIACRVQVRRRQPASRCDGPPAGGSNRRSPAARPIARCWKCSRRLSSCAAKRKRYSPAASSCGCGTRSPASSTRKSSAPKRRKHRRESEKFVFTPEQAALLAQEQLARSHRQSRG